MQEFLHVIIRGELKWSCFYYNFYETTISFTRTQKWKKNTRHGGWRWKQARKHGYFQKHSNITSLLLSWCGEGLLRNPSLRLFWTGMVGRTLVSEPVHEFDLCSFSLFPSGHVRFCFMVCVSARIWMKSGQLVSVSIYLFKKLNHSGPNNTEYLWLLYLKVTTNVSPAQLIIPLLCINMFFFLKSVFLIKMPVLTEFKCLVLSKQLVKV